MAERKSLDSLLELELENLGPWYNMDLEYPGGAVTTRDFMNKVDIIFDFEKGMSLEMIPKEETSEFEAALNQLISKGNYTEASAYISQSVLGVRTAIQKQIQKRQISFDELESLRRQYAGLVTASAPALLRMTQLTSERKYVKQAVRLMTMLDKDKGPLDVELGNDMAQFAYYFLLPMAETEPLIPIFVVQSYICGGDYDKALQAMRDTPWYAYTEKKVLAAANKVHAKKFN